VSLAVVASASAVAAGLQLADPLIGLGITLVILRIAHDSWRTCAAGDRTNWGHFRPTSVGSALAVGRWRGVRGGS
jgi:hypothetical protein